VQHCAAAALLRGELFDDVRRFEATGCTYVGTILAMLANRHPGRIEGHKLRFGFGSGAPVDVWCTVEERFGVTL
jgi:crotonobetaine/carnitine-CoA ligase